MKKLIGYFKKRRNATFYITSVAQILVVVQLFLAIFNLDYLLDTVMQNKILAFTSGLTVLLSSFGILNDPTTPGVKDKEK